MGSTCNYRTGECFVVSTCNIIIIIIIIQLHGYVNDVDENGVCA